jgi:hypothetical protein
VDEKNGRDGQRYGTKDRHRLVSPGSESRHAASVASGVERIHDPVYQYATQHGNGLDRRRKWQINPRKSPWPRPIQKRVSTVGHWL